MSSCSNRSARAEENASRSAASSSGDDTTSVNPKVSNDEAVAIASIPALANSSWISAAVSSPSASDAVKTVAATRSEVVVVRI